MTAQYRQPIAIQLPLPIFATAPRTDRSSLIVGASNGAAVARLDLWPQWPSPALALYGPEGCGKSHLIAIWAGKAEARCISGQDLSPDAVHALPSPARIAVDDAETAASHPLGAKALFHLLNRIHQEGGAVLIAGRSPPGQWATTLPDLHTRLSATPSVAIEPPDDALLAALLVKLFADRQMRPDPDLIAYLVVRMERSWAMAETVVSALDRAALVWGRRLDESLAADILAALASPTADMGPFRRKG